MPKYYCSRCKKKGDLFWLDQEPYGVKCPKCGQSLLSRVICEGCDANGKVYYYTDERHEVGDCFKCPVCGNAVKLVSKETSKILVGREATQPSSASSGKNSDPPIIRFLVNTIALIAIIVIIIQSVIPPILASISETLSAIGAAIAAFFSNLFTAIGLFLKLTGYGIAGVAALSAPVVVIRWVLLSPLHDYKAYDETQIQDPSLKDESQTQDQALKKIQTQVQELKDAFIKSRETVLKQQMLASSLVIAIALVMLFCFLGVKSFEKARQTFGRMLELGTIPMLITALIFFTREKFRKRTEKFQSLSQRFGSLSYSFIFAIASVLFMIIVPQLSDTVFTGSDAAIELFNNVVVSACTNFYENYIEIGLKKRVSDIISTAWKRFWRKPPSRSYP